MQRYLNYTTQDVDSSALEWWKAQQKDLPIPSRLACQYLYIYVQPVFQLKESLVLGAMSLVILETV